MKEVLLEIESDPRKRGIGKTVLVVDDNASIRKLLAAAFLSDGFKKCGEAANGKEAIELAERLKPDVVTLDFSMPGLSGLDVGSALRKLFPKLPIILFTLYANKQLGIAAANVGINIVLLKTEPLSTLIATAHNLIDDSTDDHTL